MIQTKMVKFLIILIPIIMIIRVRVKHSKWLNRLPSFIRSQNCWQMASKYLEFKDKVRISLRQTLRQKQLSGLIFKLTRIIRMEILFMAKLAV